MLDPLQGHADVRAALRRFFPGNNDFCMMGRNFIRFHSIESWKDHFFPAVVNRREDLFKKVKLV